MRYLMVLALLAMASSAFAQVKEVPITLEIEDYCLVQWGADEQFDLKVLSGQKLASDGAYWVAKNNTTAVVSLDIEIEPGTPGTWTHIVRTGAPGGMVPAGTTSSVEIPAGDVSPTAWVEVADVPLDEDVAMGKTTVGEATISILCGTL